MEKTVKLIVEALLLMLLSSLQLMRNSRLFHFPEIAFSMPTFAKKRTSQVLGIIWDDMTFMDNT